MDNELLEQPENSADRLKPYQFKKGQSGNPLGRPPGRSLKDRAKAYLAGLTDEEAVDFFEGMNKKDVWEMAEGKAQQDVNANVKATLNITVPPQIAQAFNIDANISTTNTETIGSDTQQEQI